jgi:hypothetical protein
LIANKNIVAGAGVNLSRLSWKGEKGMDKCNYDYFGCCSASVCYSNQKCGARDENGNPAYDDDASIMRLMRSKIEAQKQENDHLKAQAAITRKALDKMHFAYINKDGDCPHGFELEAIKAYEQAMSAAPVDYHNPADILQISGLQTALKKAEDRWTRALRDNDGSDHNANDIAKIEYLEGWSNSLEINRNAFAEMVNKRDKQIKQLYAQTAAMRDTLETSKLGLKMGMQDSTIWDIKQKIITTIDRILSTDAETYHNPSDKSEIDRLNKQLEQAAKCLDASTKYKGKLVTKIDEQTERIGRMGSALKESKRILNNALLEGCLSHVAQTSVFLQEIERLLGGAGDEKNS